MVFKGESGREGELNEVSDVDKRKKICDHWPGKNNNYFFRKDKVKKINKRKIIIMDYDLNEKEIKQGKVKTSTVQHLGQDESQWSPFWLQLYRPQRGWCRTQSTANSQGTLAHRIHIHIVGFKLWCLLQIDDGNGIWGHPTEPYKHWQIMTYANN